MVLVTGGGGGGARVAVVALDGDEAELSIHTQN